MLRKLSFITVLALFVFGLSAGQASAANDEAAAYFKGKTVSWIVPYGAGGYDIYSRIIAPFFAKHLGATVIVINKPGAGSLVGTNALFTADANGLTVGIMNTAGIIASQIAGQQGVRFDVTKFSWLGRITGSTDLLSVRSSFKQIQTPKDFLKWKKTLVFGTNGVGGSDYMFAKIAEGTLKKKLRIITQFDSTPELFTAMARGEVDATVHSTDSSLPYIQPATARALLAIGMGRDKLFPDTPDLTDIQNELTPHQFRILKALASFRATGRSVAAPPDMPADRLAFLREAFSEAMQDPALIAHAKKAKRPIQYLSGDDATELVKDALDAPKDLKDVVKSTYGHHH